ncbi:tyrosine-type recombinase/integrase [Sphingopyxis sp.]|uniref:tyrosine-type recombinase/integrase n=1 Tax=Sphingopyxis sp. TaxID=1908224 RepID=UPI003D152452
MPKTPPTKADLSTRSLRGLNPASAEVIWDIRISGFGLRTRRNNDPAQWRWVFSYREGGRGSAQVKLSKAYAEMTPEQARRWAERERGRKGTSEGERQKRLTADAARIKDKRTPTVQRLWDEYWEGEGRLKKAAHSYRQLWRDHLSPTFGSIKVTDLTPAMVERFKVTKRETPGACNRALALLSKMLSLAVLWGYREGCAPEHPVKGVSRYPEHQSEFYYTADEWGRLLEAADNDQHRAGGLALRMLALTSARLGEVTRAHWGQIEFETEEKGGGAWWTVESTNTKIGRPVTRFLDPDLAQRLLEWKPISIALQSARPVVELGQAAQWWVFPQQFDPRLPLLRLNNVWERVWKRAGVRKGRIHDLRHTGATHLVIATGSLEAAMIQCGHATPITTRRYAHVVPEVRRANGMRLAGLAAQAEEDAKARKAADKTVVPMKGQRDVSDAIGRPALQVYSERVPRQRG